MYNIDRFMDSEGKIKSFPAKREPRQAVLEYLATKFTLDRDYTEKEVNEIISSWHTFGDYFILRRELIEHKLLGRTSNGAHYWRIEALLEKQNNL